MAFPLKDNFQHGAIGPQLSADWLNTVARMLNELHAVTGDNKVPARRPFSFAVLPQATEADDGKVLTIKAGLAGNRDPVPSWETP